ncbi:hypothetical protein ACT8ZV_03680 [Nocardioides sp. MAHUQ-72]|uniref:hypothetical protein n=1 Tax=unclassified Nocardioides TaxID=2615069 RepID=UPI00360B0882
MSARVRALAGVTLLLVLAAGCGDDSTPADRVPALADRLAAVDAAVAAHDDAATRRAVDDLARTAMAAQRSGDLDQADVAAITAAAEAMVRALPAAQEDPTPDPTTSTRASDPAQAQPEDSSPAPHGHEKKDEKPKPDKHGKPEKHGKGHGH